ncbi:MAG: hypothetical protein ACTSU2_01075 [Promethearchaeota archaeon]
MEDLNKKYDFKKNLKYLNKKNNIFDFSKFDYDDMDVEEIMGLSEEILWAFDEMKLILGSRANLSEPQREKLFEVVKLISPFYIEHLQDPDYKFRSLCITIVDNMIDLFPDYFEELNKKIESEKKKKTSNPRKKND